MQVPHVRNYGTHPQRLASSRDEALAGRDELGTDWYQETVGERFLKQTGPCQQAELICGLAGNPDVLLVDETMAHMDRESAKQLHDWIMEWSASRLVAFTHHGE